MAWRGTGAWPLSAPRCSLLLALTLGHFNVGPSSAAVVTDDRTGQKYPLADCEAQGEGRAQRAQHSMRTGRHPMLRDRGLARPPHAPCGCMRAACRRCA